MCIFVKKELSKGAVQIWSGEGELESLAVLFPDVSPKLVVLAYYGAQANSFGPATPIGHLKEIFGRIAGWQEEGYQVIWSGDINVAAGRELIPGNDVVVTSGGKVFNEGVVELRLEVANNLVDDPVTHVDLKSGTRRALDLVVTNQISKINKFAIDKDGDFSPFAPRFKNGLITRTYSDHRAIVFDVKVGNIDNIKLREQNKTKAKVWMYNSKDGDLKYRILTDDLFDWLMKVIDSDIDNEQIVELIDKNIEKIKFKSYKSKSFCNSRLSDFNIGEIWSRRLQEMDKIHEEM